MRTANGTVGTPMPQLTVDRLALTVDDRRKQCHYETPERLGLKERLKSFLKKSCSCSRTQVKKFIYGKLPILDWLIGYDFKNWFVSDLVAGITVTIMQIPQGAFAVITLMTGKVVKELATFPETTDGGGSLETTTEVL
ncbi:Prestin [Armadillidium vulgare]|nr:Prestin [Armadillidium vulgare]